MSAFLYGVALQWRLDLRNRDILVTYYVVPLVFFLVMGGIFTSVMPDAKDTLIQSMSVFGVTMGAMIGGPAGLCAFYGSDRKKAWRAGGIPLWEPAVNNFLSAFVHLFLFSIIVFLVSPLAFQAKRPENPIFFFFSLALFTAVSMTIATALGLWVRRQSRLTMVSQFIFLPSMLLSGIMFPVSFLPEPLRWVGKVLPATWGMKLLCGTLLAVRLAPSDYLRRCNRVYPVPDFPSAEGLTPLFSDVSPRPCRQLSPAGPFSPAEKRVPVAFLHFSFLKGLRKQMLYATIKKEAFGRMDIPDAQCPN